MTAFGVYLAHPRRFGTPMHSPEDQAAARASADLHALVRIALAAPTRSQPGQCCLQVDVVDLWRTPGNLSRGDRIALWVDSCWRGQRSPPGDDLRLCIEDLQPGTLLEVYAAAVPGAPTPEFAVLSGQAAFR